MLDYPRARRSHKCPAKTDEKNELARQITTTNPDYRQQVGPYIICVPLWTLFIILIDATANFEPAFHHLTPFCIATYFFMHNYRNLFYERKIQKAQWFWQSFGHRNATKTTAVSKAIRTLKHSMAVPAWCWKAIFAILVIFYFIYSCESISVMCIQCDWNGWIEFCKSTLEQLEEAAEAVKDRKQWMEMSCWAWAVYCAQELFAHARFNWVRAWVDRINVSRVFQL